MPEKNQMQIFPCMWKSVYCAEFGCRRPAKWFIGRPGSPAPALWHGLCDECTREMVANIPEELHPQAEAPQQQATEEPQPEAKLEAYTCPCGQTYAGPTAKAHLGRHMKHCPVVQVDGMKEAV